VVVFVLVLLLRQNRDHGLFSLIHITLASYAIIMKLMGKATEGSPSGCTYSPCTYFMAEICREVERLCGLFPFIFCHNTLSWKMCFLQIWHGMMNSIVGHLSVSQS